LKESLLVKHNQFHLLDASGPTAEQLGGTEQGTKKAPGFNEHSAGAFVAAAALDVGVGNRLRERREALKVTQRQLGRELGVTFGQIQKYEKGSNRIGAGRLYLAAAYLRVPVKHFFEEAGDGLPADAAPVSPITTSAEFDSLKEAFLTVDPDARAAVLSLVEALAESSMAKKRRNGSA
jgi:transcriptional regulator with XRE-family HTH domain